MFLSPKDNRTIQEVRHSPLLIYETFKLLPRPMFGTSCTPLDLAKLNQASAEHDDPTLGPTNSDDQHITDQELLDMKAMICQTMLDPTSVYHTFNLPSSTLDPMKERPSFSQMMDTINRLPSLPFQAAH